MKTRLGVLVGLALAASTACAQSDVVDPAAPFSVAVFGTTAREDGAVPQGVLPAIDASATRFVVHFDLSAPSAVSCSDSAMDARRRLLDGSAKPAIPVVAASGWADCGKAVVDPLERLERMGDTFFGSDDSLGQTRIQWLRESALARFHRVRENLRWQVGRVLFMTINLPNNNNNFRPGAGRNGEFEERLVANHAWIERTFRLAAERRLAGVVIFVDAAPRFAAPNHTPDLRSRDRDGYYEWKLALRDVVPPFSGKVLLVQGRTAGAGSTGVPLRLGELDQPLQDSGGRPLANFYRTAMPDPSAGVRWLRIHIDPRDPKLFRTVVETVFDDPTGELYGPARAP